jgi:hypothetical protein
MEHYLRSCNDTQHYLIIVIFALPYHSYPLKVLEETIAVLQYPIDS